MKRYRNALLLLAVLALALLPFFVTEPSALFAGADDTAKNAIGQIAPAYRPWITPLLEPASGEIASLLFAVQAALGAGFIGYYLGVARTREKIRCEAEARRNHAR